MAEWSWCQFSIKAPRIYTYLVLEFKWALFLFRILLHRWHVVFATLILRTVAINLFPVVHHLYLLKIFLCKGVTWMQAQGICEMLYSLPGLTLMFLYNTQYVMRPRLFRIDTQGRFGMS
jgi:hypothetical protein